MKSFLFYIFLLFFLILLGEQIFGVSHGAQQMSDDITLKNDIWSVRINPASLKIIAIPKNHKTFVISSSQSRNEEIDGLTHDDGRIKWFLQDKKIKISMQLDKRDLYVNIEAQSPGLFTFPIISQSDNLKALILPHWQGIYVPMDDEQWKKILLSRTFDTIQGLTMPFFGLDLKTYTLTYMATNMYNNKLSFKPDNKAIQANFTHEFTKNRPRKEYGFIIRLGKNYSPVEPAIEFRNYLVNTQQFISMKEKLKSVPKADRLRGAIHAYLWGSLQMSFDDVLPNQWKALCSEIIQQADSNQLTPGKRIKETMPPKYWDELVKLSNLKYRPYTYIKSIVAEGLSKTLSKEDFFKKDYFTEIEIPKEVLYLIDHKNIEGLSKAQLFRANAVAFHLAYPNKVRNTDDWGYGYSKRMLRELKASGIKRARLTHDIWDFGMIDFNPEVAIEADKMGYLLGPYDSYHSIHDPKYFGNDISWPTAQFDQDLFKIGGIQLENGKMKSGFQNRGVFLSPLAAKPWVEKRVVRLMKNTPYNSYFMDCDAYGEVFDDYSPQHPATQEDDVAARINRMKWISDAYHVVIGSEGGSSYAAPVIHVAEGMMSNAFGEQSDPDFVKKESKFFLGRHYPMHNPEFFIKRVPLKNKFVFSHYDPRFRLPLNEIVFHDSFVSTNHYESASKKFYNVQDLVELTSLLYLTPPMYHLNVSEFNNIKHDIKKYYDFFYPLHEKMGFAQMTNFIWLTKDRLVQKTVFDHEVEMVANFKDTVFVYSGSTIPPKGILAKWIKSGKTSVYTPGKNSKI